MPLNTGKRIFVCGDCGNRGYFSLKAANRASRIRCTACGSYRLDPSPSSKANDEIIRANTEKPATGDVKDIRKIAKD